VLAGGRIDNVGNHFTDQLDQREVLQRNVEKAPCITFSQFRQVAKQRWRSNEWFTEHVKGEIDRPSDTLRRILHGAVVDGKQHLLADVVISYRCLIELYQGATLPKLALVGEKACACGCGAKVTGKRKWARPGCRKRVQRGSVIPQKSAV
jgi:hypothetical protein